MSSNLLIYPFRFMNKFLLTRLVKIFEGAKIYTINEPRKKDGEIIEFHTFRFTNFMNLLSGSDAVTISR